MSYYDTLPPDKKARCRFTFFGDSVLTGHVADTGLVMFDYKTDRLTPANVTAIIRELEKLPEETKERLNGILQSWGAKTRL